MLDMLYDQAGQPNPSVIQRAASGLDRLKAVLTAVAKNVPPTVACSKYNVPPALLEGLLQDPLFKSAPMVRSSQNRDRALAADIFEAPEEDLDIPDARLAFSIPMAIDSLPDKEACAILRVYYANGAPANAKTLCNRVMSDAELSSALQSGLERLRHPQRKEFIRTGVSLSSVDSPYGPISRRLANILTRRGILVLADLEQMTRAQAGAMRGVGNSILHELQKLLNDNGTAFTGQEKPSGKAGA